MVWTVMPSYGDYETARNEFSWELPDQYNPATDFIEKHDQGSVALTHETPAGETTQYTFGEIDEHAGRLASGLSALGIGSGDRVGVVVPQHPANPITHLANWKIGAVSVPLTVLFGPEALTYRLEDSGARAVVAHHSVIEDVIEATVDSPDLEHIVEVGGSADGDITDFDELVEGHDALENSFESTPETPTAIMYTSGSTGPPKGVLHSHALWLGRAAAAYNYFDQGLGPEATLWTPADWAWGAALGGTLFAGWHHGADIVGWPRDGFDPEAVFALLERHHVTHTFMPPTALRMCMSVADPVDRYDLSLEVIASAGEPLTPEVVEWVETAFGDVAINEFYGQTELNLVVGNCSGWFETRPGSMGRPLPGYEVAALDEETREPVETGTVGELAVRPADRRVFFDEYWQRPEQTAAKQTEDGWFLTGDLVEQDDDGFCWFVSRSDDVILTSGYRVGPMEVEEVILEHEAVEQAGVIGVPDDTRGEAIAAFVTPVEPAYDPDSLTEEIQSLVRDRLAEYEYPRHVTVVDSLPTTTTGKIRRQSLRERAPDTLDR